MFPQVMAVDPDVGIHVYTIKKQGHQFILIILTQCEVFAIPGGSAHDMAGGCPAGAFLREGPHLFYPFFSRKVLYAVIVGQIQAAPGGIIQSGILAVLHIGADKLPFCIQQRLSWLVTFCTGDQERPGDKGQ